MNSQEMTDIVREDLKHIPKGYGARHGWLRTYYNRRRRHDLAKGKTSKEETMAYCIAEIQKEDPRWHAEFDPTYFNLNLVSEFLSQFHPLKSF